MTVKLRGGPPASPVIRRAVELLEDGEPHLFDEIVREVGKTIAPGVAIRKNEIDRRRISGTAERVQPLSVERQIESGRRTIVRAALRGRHFELSERDGRRYVRLVSVPARVLRDREAEAAGVSLDPARVLDAIEAGEDVTMLLHDLTRPALMRVTLALAAHIASSGR